MKKIVTLIVMSIVMTCMNVNAQYKPTQESLRYRVMYKWGLINKQAGTVTVDTHTFSDGYFNSTLVGKSATWADKFYTVRDTLMGTIMMDRYEPVYYERIAHEGGDFKRDIITYDRTTSQIKGQCQRWRQKKNADEVVHSTKLITGTGVTLDMLSAFYYMRHLDYPAMKAGESVTTNIFSGQKKETLRITYRGKKTLDVDGKKYSCYYLNFSFTSDNGKKSSDDMSAWISVDDNRIPILLMGNLPIGSIRCYYIP